MHQPAARRRRTRAGEATAASDIVSALERLLEERSIGEITVPHILDAAGVARGTFYFWFTSKYDVVAHAHRLISSQILSDAAAWFENPYSPPQAVGPVLRGFVATYLAHAHVLNAACETWHSQPEVRATWNEMMGGLITNVESLIRAQQRQGVARPGIDARRTAEALVWMNERTVYMATSRSGYPAPIEKVADTLIEIWIATLYGAQNAGGERRTPAETFVNRRDQP